MRKKKLTKNQRILKQINKMYVLPKHSCAMCSMTSCDRDYDIAMFYKDLLEKIKLIASVPENNELVEHESIGGYLIGGKHDD